jgi:hypothetical protein
MVFSSKDETKIQEFVTERAYPVSTVINNDYINVC